MCVAKVPALISLSSIRSALIITRRKEKFRTQASRTNPPLFPNPNPVLNPDPSGPVADPALDVVLVDPGLDSDPSVADPTPDPIHVDPVHVDPC